MKIDFCENLSAKFKLFCFVYLIFFVPWSILLHKRYQGKQAYTSPCIKNSLHQLFQHIINLGSTESYYLRKIANEK